MLTLAAVADKENRLDTGAATDGIGGAPKDVPKKKRKQSEAPTRIRRDAWKADKLVQHLIHKKAIVDVEDFEGLASFIEKAEGRERAAEGTDRLARFVEVQHKANAQKGAASIFV